MSRPSWTLTWLQKTVTNNEIKDQTPPFFDPSLSCEWPVLGASDRNSELCSYRLARPTACFLTHAASRCPPCHSSTAQAHWQRKGSGRTRTLRYSVNAPRYQRDHMQFQSAGTTAHPGCPTHSSLPCALSLKRISYKTCTNIQNKVVDDCENVRTTNRCTRLSNRSTTKNFGRQMRADHRWSARTKWSPTEGTLPASRAPRTIHGSLDQIVAKPA